MSRTGAVSPRGCGPSRLERKTRKRGGSGSENDVFAEIFGADRPRKFDCDPALGHAYDVGERRSDDDDRSDRRLEIDEDRRARHGDVGQRSGVFGAVREADGGMRMGWRHAFVASVLGQAKGSAVGEPGQLIRKTVAFRLRKPHLNGEAAREGPYDRSLEPPDLIEVGDDTLARPHLRFGEKSDAARRDVDGQAIELLTIRTHEAPGQSNL